MLSWDTILHDSGRNLPIVKSLILHARRKYLSFKLRHVMIREIHSWPNTNKINFCYIISPHTVKYTNNLSSKMQRHIFVRNTKCPSRKCFGRTIALILHPLKKLDKQVKITIRFVSYCWNNGCTFLYALVQKRYPAKT